MKKSADQIARANAWYGYYTEKRIGHQWFQAHLLRQLDVATVLEVGPAFGLVTAMLVNAGYEVTTLDFQDLSDHNPRVRALKGDVTKVEPEVMSGFDCIICCETLEHIDWADVDDVLARFIASGVPHLIISVPYEGFQLAWRYYANGHKMVSNFSLKWRGLFKRFRFDAEADPHCHRWGGGLPRPSPL
jgi:hypothetical protein